MSDLLMFQNLNIKKTWFVLPSHNPSQNKKYANFYLILMCFL